MKNQQPKILQTISVDQAWHYGIVPLEETDGLLTLMMAEHKLSASIKDELETILDKRIVINPVPEYEVNEQLTRAYPRAASAAATKADTSMQGNVLENLVAEALSMRSSDIHIESYSEHCRIRLRVDGVLIDRHSISKRDYPALINKIKIAARCDIAEKRLPQDGRIRMKAGHQNIDIRVSILPALYGEKIVLRLLGNDATHIDIQKLGLQAEESNRYSLAVQKPYGIILISGPTGSGKTTTLYATLKLLSKPTNNIVTIEDPIEYTLDGINQVQLKEEIGLTFTEALRAFLRQDPDIIMLGEIRDAQTAQMAVRAALTGHLVLSTIHTNSAWGTVSRLIDMGVAPYLVASVLNLSVAQRLIRTLCRSCSKPFVPDLSGVPSKYRNVSTANCRTSVGCSECHYTGFKGRKAIYEVIEINRELAEMIRSNATDISGYLLEKNIRTLAENALRLLESGESSLVEIYPYLIGEYS